MSPWWARRRRGTKVDHTAGQLAEAAERLVADTGELVGDGNADALAAMLSQASDDVLLEFFLWLEQAMGPDPVAMTQAAHRYLHAPNSDSAHALSRASEPRRQLLFRRLNAARGGTALIVGLRARMLPLLGEHPSLRTVDGDLVHLLGSWFNRGFLELRRIDWNTSAAVLERLIAYEAVHEIGSWEELRARLDEDRLCYAFFHPALPYDPVIFVEVALTSGYSSAIAPLIDPTARGASSRPDTAIFYSISNCQPGLRGISFGNSLIKLLTRELQAQHPTLSRFGTLSPVPGFGAWLARTGALHQGGAAPGELARLCAVYLTDSANRDPVAHFHLTNGARLERINEEADLSAKGMRQSRGVMVNYRYDEQDWVANHTAYVQHGRVTVAPAVQALLDGPARSRWSTLSRFPAFQRAG